MHSDGEQLLCLDDWFLGCDGTRTHPLKLSEILAIPEVKRSIEASHSHLIEEVTKLRRDESETHTTMRGMVTAIERDNKEQQIKGWNQCLNQVISLLKRKGV